MAVTSDHEAVQVMLMTVLGASAPLTAIIGASSIFDSEAPEGETYPFVVFQFVPGAPDEHWGNTGKVAMSRFIYLIKGVVNGYNSLLALQIAGAIFDALDGLTNIQDAYTLNVRRIEPYAFPTFENGEHYRTAGGRYEITVRA